MEKKSKNSRLVHDANNVLTAIAMSAELLAQGIAGKVNVKQKKYAQGILSDVRKIQRLLMKIER